MRLVVAVPGDIAPRFAARAMHQPSPEGESLSKAGSKPLVVLFLHGFLHESKQLPDSLLVSGDDLWKLVRFSLSQLAHAMIHRHVTPPPIGLNKVINPQ